MKVILIGNYSPDQQESMERFALMMYAGFKSAGVDSEIWRPNVYLGKWVKSTGSGFGKWVGYLDKWIAFPLVLRIRLLNKLFKAKDVRFHICDHSNSPYLKYLPADRAGITCHDVLAIRGALGFKDSYCPASPFGKLLQKWILYHLKRCRFIAAVSQLTLDQLKDIAPDTVKANAVWRVIHNSFNANFAPLGFSQKRSSLGMLGMDQEPPYILHVGSGLTRKNRKLLLDMVDTLGPKWNGNICFAGEAMDEALKSHAVSLKLQDRVISIVKPDHNALVALYSFCEAFVFPSLSEGFGWPVIEAQACGAPVISSNIAPMPEVSGNAAILLDPTKPNDFANALLSLKNTSLREEIISKGARNISNFKTSVMMDKYLKLYNLEPLDNK